MSYCKVACNCVFDDGWKIINRFEDGGEFTELDVAYFADELDANTFLTIVTSIDCEEPVEEGVWYT